MINFCLVVTPCLNNQNNLQMQPKYFIDTPYILEE